MIVGGTRPLVAYSGAGSYARSGVSFFFVLSGFIIAYAYPKLDSCRAIMAFLVARVARIWPAHFVALLLTLAFLKPADHPGDVGCQRIAGTGLDAVFAWYFSYNAVSWSISTEMFFYLVFPALIFRWRRSWWWKWLLSASLIFALIRLSEALHLSDLLPAGGVTTHGLLYINPLARLFEFVTGMVVCSVFGLLQSAARKLPDAAFTLLEILIGAAVVYSIMTGLTAVLMAPYFSAAGWQWLTHASDVVTMPFLILVFAFGRGRMSQLLGSAPMVLLGDMSYSLYLVHNLVFYYYYVHLETDRAAADYIGLGISIAAMLAISFIMLTFIEAPCRAAAKRWLKKRATLPFPAT